MPGNKLDHNKRTGNKFFQFFLVIIEVNYFMLMMTGSA